MGAVTEKQLKNYLKKGIGEAQLKGLPVENERKAKNNIIFSNGW